MPSATYDALNKAWKSTCKVIFCEEIGNLAEYEGWLTEFLDSQRAEKSAKSGKAVYLGVNDYCKGAKFQSFDEADFGRKFEPMNINEVKDIEGILQALSERAFYTGNVVLGSSHFVEGSSNVVDSAYVYNSTIVADSKYIAYSTLIRQNAYTFGTYGDGLSEYGIRLAQGHENRRCFECYASPATSDAHYCTDCHDCHDVMFCFGAYSKSHAIGNLPLPKEKYAGIKARLLGEFRDRLRKEKKLFSLLEIIRDSRKFAPEIAGKFEAGEKEGSTKTVEGAFTRTSGLVLGKKLYGIDAYAKYLNRHVVQNGVAKSPLSGRKALLAGYLVHLTKYHDVDGRLVRADEIGTVGSAHIKEDSAQRLKADAAALAGILHPVAYMTMDLRIGTAVDVVDAAIIAYSESCYHGNVFAGSKKCACCFWPRNSEHVFGSSCLFESSFCMNAHYSKKLTRCFECDGCESSSDLYYSHNCENVQEGMFCFNSKNLRHAIGNAAYDAEKYKRLKSQVLEQVSGELERKKEFRWDIYNIGCFKK